MKFYGRSEQLARLQEIQKRSHQRGQMTVVSGRRRIGKTRLITESLRDARPLYFFITRESERLLCRKFSRQVETHFGTRLLSPPERFVDLLELLLVRAQTEILHLVIDEFQEFLRINPSIYSQLQELWDRYRDQSKINLILSGSVESLMVRIFDTYSEPLYGRADHRFVVPPLGLATLRQILDDHYPTYSPDDLILLYAITGGVPRYLEAFVDSKNLQHSAILTEFLQPDGFFYDEGRFLLLQEFGKDYATYFSVLQLIAVGRTSRGQIENILQQSVGGYLTKLQEKYQLIDRHRPMFSKPQTTNVRYYIKDEFLRFWFRFIFRHSGAVESRNYDLLRKYIERDYPTFAGETLERMIRKNLRESKLFSQVGNYWQRGNVNEIDVIAIDDFNKRVVIGEVKTNPAAISLDRLRLKAQDISRQLGPYVVEYRGFSPEDILTAFDFENEE